LLVRYYLDEHIDPAIGAGLRARGIDVLTTIESGHEQASDLEQLEFARGEHRVIVTRDSDFLALAAQGIEHAGIVFWHSKRRSIGKLVHRLVALWRTMTGEDMRNRVQFF
jgi:hypothetical protein